MLAHVADDALQEPLVRLLHLGENLLARLTSLRVMVEGVVPVQTLGDDRRDFHQVVRRIAQHDGPPSAALRCDLYASGGLEGPPRPQIRARQRPAMRDAPRLWKISVVDLPG